MSKKFTPKQFLATFREAMEQSEALAKAVEWPDKYDTPEMVHQGERGGWEVGEKEIEQFRTVLDFLRLAVFGVDADGRRRDAAVKIRVLDRTREEDFLPSVRVPRTDWDAPLEKQWAQLDAAKLIASSVQHQVELMQKQLDRDLEKLIKKEARLRKAEHCEVCDGKGWVKTDAETWLALDYGEKCRTEDIGCDYRLKEARPRGVYRLFCECQDENEGVRD